MAALRAPLIPPSIPKRESSWTLSCRIPSRRLFFEFPGRGCPCWRRTTPFRARMGVVPSRESQSRERHTGGTGRKPCRTPSRHCTRGSAGSKGRGSGAGGASYGLEEAEKYIQMVKQQQQRGLRKLKGEKGDDNSGYGYRVDPYTLRPGDYVVHKKVGIGRFVGIKYDYAFIEYGDGMAKLPVNKAKKCSIVIICDPNETKRPRALSKLSDTSAWERRRTKGKIAIQKMVAFIDVEKDLTERGTPMDRLICGDVGFGKTEQAMVLAPTIVLAKQHFDVISERFSHYPNIKIGLLSRFQTKSEKEGYLSMIKDGDLDIIVGTHALLGNRVVYNNLGLLVVDEEQRFGVKQKERIASFKTSVDVLTLSATPIPRTLYLALTGFRDASLISTPPPERVPIRTHLSAYSKDKILEAIKFELDRSGQVFYVLPRIKGLEEVMELLEQSFPDVSIAIAHGKQYSKQLEDTMEKFSLGEIKILICTNIVESGLDIQNANTIIIQDVHQFGLAQLYQVLILVYYLLNFIAWRVGRADKEAFAYLFFPDKSLLSDQALERLAALEECHDLGQGFQLAERDMGIRGFGNIFGEQQTGDVGNVGIDLFFEMLFESLSKVEEHRLVSVPYKHVQLINEAEKAAEKDIWSLMHFTECLRRQYGKEPRSMEILLKKLYVRRMAADLGINKIYASGKTVCMRTDMSKKVFRIMTDSMASDIHRNCLVFEANEIKAELLLELPAGQLLNWIFQCLSELYAALPALVKY
ncbi:unnamed protein product [Spirodela intermedia]|uniref:Uncharacterized protein n=1 Tax=Spirodela intermedia TaxID=51605 RepID=A0A7I8INU7_SPIIN|nr:unnamed protein product [Spirodela intermedia]CAA6659645.1 unnamed protein product [Spirodela intermedia]